ncbi:MAG: HD domain-containing phosphohydrolase [Candidatus Aminicenantales bacterium]
MNYKRAFLRGKVAQRMSFLFIICALFPIGILALLSFRNVTNQLYQQSQSRLHQANKLISMSIYERLVLLEAELIRVASDVKAVPLANQIRATQDYGIHLKERFNSLEVLTDKDIPLSLFGEIENRPRLTFEMRQKVLSGQTLITTQCDPSRISHIYMSISVEPAPHKKYILQSEINPDYLWQVGDESFLPPLTKLLVLDHARNVLFSSWGSVDAASAEPTRNGIDRSPVFFEWAEGQTRYLADQRELFLQSGFVSQNWTIILSEPKAYSFAPIAYFKKTFPLVVLLSIWVVLFLSLSQIRRTLAPLIQLKEGAQRVAKKDFDSRVIIKSHDEFSEVASSFNEMTVQLGRQFKTLTTIAELDGAILSSLDAKKIVMTLLGRIPVLFPCQGTAITILNTKTSSSGWTYTAKNNPGHDIPVERINIEPADMQRLRANPETFSLEAQDSLPQYVRTLSRQGIRWFQVFPVFLKQHLAGIICLGYENSPELSPEELNQARQVSDQVGIALSNAELVAEVKQFNQGTLTALARAIDAKSSWTAGHSERVTKIALAISRAAGLSKSERAIILRGGFLHDIGKLGIPNEILDKPGALTPQERIIMQEHPRLGARILEPISAYTDIMRIVLEHHENYDGSGYPNGLAGEQISFYSRIFSVADSYDAMTSDRPYRKALDRKTTVESIKMEAGKKYDPMVVDLFLKTIDDIDEEESDEK